MYHTFTYMYFLSCDDELYMLKSNKTSVLFCYVKTYLSIIIEGTQIITNKRKNTCFYKITHFFMQFSAIVNRFIVKT